MIADQKILTLKKLPEFHVALAFGGIFILILTAMAIVREHSLFSDFFVVAVQGGLVAWLGFVYHRTDKALLKRATTQLPGAKLEAELKRLREKCQARAFFIESTGSHLLETSRAMYDTARFLHSKRQAVRTPNAGGGVEADLLRNADQVYTFSRDIVLLAQLKKGSLSLLEQKVDAVELFRFCSVEVKKSLANGELVELVNAPSQSLLISGDLTKLKKILVKLLTCAVGLLQIKGAKIRVGIFQDENSQLVFSIKLSGHHLSEKEFAKLCCPLDNFSENDQHGDLNMAIARRLAQLHDGDIVIHQQSSSGTVLAFFLPEKRISRSVCIQARGPECR